MLTSSSQRFRIGAISLLMGVICSGLGYFCWKKLSLSKPQNRFIEMEIEASNRFDEEWQVDPSVSGSLRSNVLSQFKDQQKRSLLSHVQSYTHLQDGNTIRQRVYIESFDIGHTNINRYLYTRLIVFAPNRIPIQIRTTENWERFVVYRTTLFINVHREHEPNIQDTNENASADDSSSAFPGDLQDIEFIKNLLIQDRKVHTSHAPASPHQSQLHASDIPPANQGGKTSSSFETSHDSLLPPKPPPFTDDETCSYLDDPTNLERIRRSDLIFDPPNSMLLPRLREVGQLKVAVALSLSDVPHPKMVLKVFQTHD